jgi:hypothetical protein
MTFGDYVFLIGLGLLLVAIGFWLGWTMKR